MGPLQKAIQQFAKKRLEVYKIDPEQIVRDARATARATGDHAGRWLFELLQNSDDAGATEVLVAVEGNAIYVADNGRGLKPGAVSAICGTDFSDKTGGTIGRKGVGFKSVYEVSRNPQVLATDGEGIEFGPKRAKEWLQQNSIDHDHVPYQWIPFFVSWNCLRQKDPHLETLRKYSTVVRLCDVAPEMKQRAEQLLCTWPSHSLFAFRHLRQITGPGLEVVLSTGDGVWSLRDSRGQTPIEWQVRRHTKQLPEDLLDGLGEDERRAISRDGVGFLIAAPLKNGRAVPTDKYLPVHVFYPSEQTGPVQLLLHAEFLVKSDRTALMPLDACPPNAWIAERLAHYICEFVNASYCPESPSSHVSLLVPFPDRASHPVAKDLWQRTATKARFNLRLADTQTRQRLTAGGARLISVSVRADLARILLEATGIRRQLLHHTFDDDEQARAALRELGCKEVHDEDLTKAIARNADSFAADIEWVWACWEWLAAWIAKEPYGKEHDRRIECAKTLPIVPVNGRLLKPSDLAEHIVTWRPDTGVGALPEWLPLTFVKDWFRDRIRNDTQQEFLANTLCAALDIRKPAEDVIQRAVGRAIEQYWNDRQGDPERFLRFIIEQDWHETFQVLPELQRCPVPLIHPVQGDAWTEACIAYFGRDWDDDSLAELYDGIAAVAWVAHDDAATDNKKHRRVLEWLGVAQCPRIVEECQHSYVWKLPEGLCRWKQYLEAAQDCDGRRAERIASISRMDHLVLDCLDARLGSLLIRLIAQHWEKCYRDCVSIIAEGTRGYEQYYRPWRVDATWWWEICEELPLPKRDGSEEHVALRSLWLPNKGTERAIGELLPVIDLDAFGSDRDIVRDWLANMVHLRTGIEQLTVEDWKELLSTRIPGRAPAERLLSDERLRDKVTGWYAACLETVAEQEDVSQNAFASCPVLCRKANSWSYAVQEPRYLEDDNDLAATFAKDVWLFHVPARQASHALKYFGILSLSESVKVEVMAGERNSPLPDRLQARFSKSLPYVWAWRSSQSKQAAEQLSTLKILNVRIVPGLKASLSLDGVHHEVERRWHVVDETTILLHAEHANEASLAQALAKTLEVRSEADFYEHLLRDEHDDERKGRLVNKGMTDRDVEWHLREYSGRPAEEQQDGNCQKPVKDQHEDKMSQAPSADGGQRRQREQSSARQQDSTSQKLSGSSETGGEPLRPKNASSADYVLGSPIVGDAGRSTVGAREGGTEREGCPLTDAEKTELELAGRTIAARELERLGFSVEQMSPGNPGFDLRSRKDSEELRVEVKAHGGRATVVDVTQREYKEYLDQQGYRWELWNVEHLAVNDPNPVILTRFDAIPDDALNVRTFRVDLKKCRSLHPS